MHVLRGKGNTQPGGGGSVGCQRCGCPQSCAGPVLRVLRRPRGTWATHVASNLRRFRHRLRIKLMHVAHTPRGRVNLILIDAIAAAAAVGSLPLGCPCCWSSIRLSALLVLIVCPTDCLLAQRSLNAICVAFASHQHPGSPCSPHSPPQVAGILVYDFDRFYLIFPLFFCCLFSELFSGVLLLFWSFTLLLPFQFAICGKVQSARK